MAVGVSLTQKPTRTKVLKMMQPSTRSVFREAPFSFACSYVTVDNYHNDCGVCSVSELHNDREWWETNANGYTAEIYRDLCSLRNCTDIGERYEFGNLNLKIELFYRRRKLSAVITGFFGQKKNMHVSGTVTLYLFIIFVGRSANCKIFIFVVISCV